MKVLVCGGRDFRNAAFIRETLDQLHSSKAISHVITGGAKGADDYGHWWAYIRGVQTVMCEANWKSHGRAAGVMRNARMLALQPDLVVSFPGGRGTAHMIGIARAASIPVIEYSPPDGSAETEGHGDRGGPCVFHSCMEPLPPGTFICDDHVLDGSPSGVPNVSIDDETINELMSRCLKSLPAEPWHSQFVLALRELQELRRRATTTGTAHQ